MAASHDPLPEALVLRQLACAGADFTCRGEVHARSQLCLGCCLALGCVFRTKIPTGDIRA